MQVSVITQPEHGNLCNKEEPETLPEVQQATWTRALFSSLRKSGQADKFRSWPVLWKNKQTTPFRMFQIMCILCSHRIVWAWFHFRSTWGWGGTAHSTSTSCRLLPLSLAELFHGVRYLGFQIGGLLAPRQGCHITSTASCRALRLW